ncbi:MAG: hypothetical protein AAGE61_17835 [Pseudomonadota bacterium]
MVKSLAKGFLAALVIASSYSTLAKADDTSVFKAENRTNSPARLFYFTEDGRREVTAVVPPRGFAKIHSYLGHTFRFEQRGRFFGKFAVAHHCGERFVFRGNRAFVSTAVSKRCRAKIADANSGDPSLGTFLAINPENYPVTVARFSDGEPLSRRVPPHGSIRIKARLGDSFFFRSGDAVYPDEFKLDQRSGARFIFDPDS